ncbi:MAG: hypothetical protein NZ894_04200, partial [Archaeoglobaceae archaeon]|nr:hypothetical protein [Archaeoglobaceae archaeon]
MPQIRSSLIFVFLLTVLVCIQSEVESAIVSPAPSPSPNVQILGVGGTTLSLNPGQSAYYNQSLNSGEKIKVEAKNFTGGTGVNICIYIESNPDRTSLASQCGSTSPISVEYEEKTVSKRNIYIGIEVKSAPSRIDNIHLTWTKYVRSWGFWVDKEEGRKREAPVEVSGGYRIEGTFGTYGEPSNWYKFIWSLPIDKPAGYITAVVSLNGSNGTNFDMRVYNKAETLIATNTSSVYPTYLLVKDTEFPIKVEIYHPYKASNKTEYHLANGYILINDRTVSPTSVKPGQSFTIGYNINSYVFHSIPVILGATIRKSDETSVFYHNPGNDTTVTVPYGSSTHSRSFYVPKNARLGTYNLEIGLWGVKNPDGSLDYNFHWRIFQNQLRVEVPRNPEITTASASPSTLAPGDSTTLTVKWIFYNACPSGCLVYANAFGDWAKTTELCKIYGGFDSDYGNEKTKSCTIQIPQDITLGTHYIRVGFCYQSSYARSYDELARCTYTDVPINVQKVSTSVSISPSSFRIESGQTQNFIARLIDSSGNGVANRVISFTCGIGQGSCSCNPSTSYTDSSGYASSACTATVSVDTTMSVRAAFGGDYRYSSSSANATGSVVVPTYQVTVNPNGGRIYVDGSPITTPTTYNWASGTSHTLDPDSGYEPSPGVRKIFSRWSDGNSEDPRTIVVTSSATYTAIWQDQYRLNISVSPSGAGTTNPAPGIYWHNQGAPVTVTATPASGYAFSHWELNGVNVGSSPSYTVTMNSPNNLTAVFRQANQTYQVTVNPNGGRIYVDGSPITTPTT